MNEIHILNAEAGHSIYKRWIIAALEDRSDAEILRDLAQNRADEISRLPTRKDRINAVNRFASETRPMEDCTPHFWITTMQIIKKGESLLKAPQATDT